MRYPDNMDSRLDRLIDHWGNDNQIIVAMEELAELIKELSHHIRDKQYNNEIRVISEIADVIIMIEQLIKIFNIDDETLKRFITDQTARALYRID